MATAAPTSDADLLRRHQAGEAAAFAMLVHRHAGLVHASATRRFPAAADDVAQASFLVLLQRPDAAAKAARRPGGLSAWLLATVRNVSRNAAKRQRRREFHESRAMTMNASIAGDDPAEALAWRELSPIVDDAVLALPSADRAAILLKFYENAASPEIGRRLGITPEAARQRVSRALMKLRRQLERRGVAVPAAVLVSTLAAQAAKSAPPQVVSACLSLSAGTVPATLLLLTTGTAMSTKLTLAAAVATVVGLAVVGTSDLAVGDDATTRPAADAAAEPARALPAVAERSARLEATYFPPDGRVHERVIHRGDTLDPTLDLDNGILSSLADIVDEDGTVDVDNRFAAATADLYLNDGALSPGLRTTNMVARPVLSEAWDFPVAAKQVASLWDETLESRNLLDAVGELPRTYVYRTSQGAGGVLQIVERVDAPMDSPTGLRVQWRVLTRGEGVDPYWGRNEGGLYGNFGGGDLKPAPIMRAMLELGLRLAVYRNDRGEWPADLAAARAHAKDDWPQNLPDTLVYVQPPERDPASPRFTRPALAFERVTPEAEGSKTAVVFDDGHVEAVDAHRLRRLVEEAGLDAE